MSRPILIQIAVELSLAAAVGIFLVLGWWIPAAIAAVAALAAALWMRRAVVDMRNDEAMAAAETHDKTNEN